jgi:hypothetical protein
LDGASELLGAVSLGAHAAKNIAKTIKIVIN